MPSLRKCGLILAACCLAWSWAASADAQLCGDPDGDGGTTVNDGVQALRAAAFLSSTCSLGTCDLDGSGTITINDGLAVLRKAAGLSAPNLCGGINADAQDVVSQVQPFLGIGLALIPGASTAAHPAAIEDCDNVGEGTVELTDTQVILDFCQLDGVEYNGTITLIATNTFEFELALDDVVTGEFIDIFGALTVRDNGNSLTVIGSLEFTTSLVGDFVIGFNSLEFAFDIFGNVVFLSGSVSLAELFDETDLGSVDSLAITYDGSATARVDVVLDDGRFGSFFLNLLTGQLTPI